MDNRGTLVTGAQLDYNGQTAGYSEDPSEVINYISAHDNQTLFDNNQYKLPIGTGMSDRVRVNNLGLALVGLAQGIPFFHAGDDILRSKSFDRNSYNSGDWFNRLDWTYQTNNFAVGLPPEWDNRDDWPIMEALFEKSSNQAWLCRYLFIPSLFQRSSSDSEIVAALSITNRGKK